MEAPSQWARVRAGLIAAVLGLNVVIATPQPGPMTEQRMKRPEAVEELDAWVAALDGVGIETSRAELAELSGEVVNRWSAFRKVAITRPTRFLRRWLGIRQSWALFARPDTFPATLVVHLRREPGPDWEEVYRSLDPEHDLMAAQLRYRRIRGLWDGPTGPPSATTRNVYRWIAGAVMDRRPEAEAVRVRLIRSHTVRPGQPEDPRQLVVHGQAWSREDLR